MCKAHVDGDLVVIHDLTVDRTSDGTGGVRELSTAQLGRLSLRGTDGEPIPHLNNVLALLRRHGAASILEVKFRTDAPEHEDLCRRMVDAIAHADMLEATTISAFTWPSLVTLKRLAPRRQPDGGRLGARAPGPGRTLCDDRSCRRPRRERPRA